MERTYKMSGMNALELAFAKLVYGVELVLNYSTGEWIVTSAHPSKLRQININFIP